MRARARLVSGSGSSSQNRTPWVELSKSRRLPRALLHGGHDGLAQKMSARGNFVMSARATSPS
jgi:hypothetical protein